MNIQCNLIAWKSCPSIGMAGCPVRALSQGRAGVTDRALPAAPADGTARRASELAIQEHGHQGPRSSRSKYSACVSSISADSCRGDDVYPWRCYLKVKLPYVSGSHRDSWPASPPGPEEVGGLRGSCYPAPLSLALRPQPSAALPTQFTPTRRTVCNISSVSTSHTHRTHV